MFRPTRLLALALLAFLVYEGFYATPGGAQIDGTFDPELMAEHEADTWRAVQTHDDFSTYLNTILLLREQNRYTWYRAADAGYRLGRATSTFVGMTTKYERIMPDLEATAAAEKDWRKARFDPNEVARAQLTWWVTGKTAGSNTIDQVAGLMAQEYGLRYQIDPGQVIDAATLRAEAAQLRDQGGPDPDWPAVTRLLTRSYRSLADALERKRLTPARRAAR